MNQANNLAQVDVLGWLASQVESHRALSMSDAYYAQELPRVEAAYSAVAELVARLDRLDSEWRTRAVVDNDGAFLICADGLTAALRPFTGERA